ncbi:MAG TPA: tyrosine--tRNA ligase [Firmicutes bacterium]|jgi:tyrosyl-tRNA synthetase|nr:tyrosine--tRNA ligase [Bacillota bacterium]HHT42408.1 tyrosine--tRNA ligase [Bacillota bacterium]
MRNVLDVLEERGFVEQITHREELRELLAKESVTFYVGFDATAPSLTLGHLIPVMSMLHLYRAGHRPIFVMGGGTTMIGDPSGKSEMRQMLAAETIAQNIKCFHSQFSRFVNFEDGSAIMVNNAEWLLDLNFMEFMREIGRHFSVNRMLSMEAYKSRLDTGLTFLEFSYLLTQSYDFLELFRRYNCRLQIGGNDQWSNIIGGCELVRKVEGAEAYGLTLKLLTTNAGTKMGKTEKGTVWLDAERTSPYDFYQYLRNIDDAYVESTLGLLTFLPMEEVRRLGSLQGSEINQAKEVLAFEVTKFVHGEEEAVKAQEAAKAVFGGGGTHDSMPSTTLSQALFQAGMDILTLLTELKLASSRSEARRLVTQGGITLGEERVEDIERTVTLEDFTENELIVRKGKKVYHRVIIE